MMRLDQFIAQHVIAVSANDYAADAVDLMQRHSTDRAVVLDGDRVAGVVFRKDMSSLSDAILKDRDVREYMVTDITAVSPETDVDEAQKLLHRKRQACLTVSWKGRVTGIVTAGDLDLPGGKAHLQAS